MLCFKENEVETEELDEEYDYTNEEPLEDDDLEYEYEERENDYCD